MIINYSSDNNDSNRSDNKVTDKNKQIPFISDANHLLPSAP
jgi:hypothetical protein